MSQVTLYAKHSTWLSAPQTILTVSKSILGGEVVDVPGSIVLKIKRPTAVATERSLRVDDGIPLGAYMSGIERVIGGFHIPRSIVFQHPVLLDNPRYLKCVTPGQEVLFKWKVRNFHDALTEGYKPEHKAPRWG